MSTTTDAIGRVLAGRYRLETVIGTGASAHVFAALDVALQRRVAIKVLHPALAAEAGFLRRFRAEAQAAAALNNPGIVAVFDWGEDYGSPFLVLQHLAGGSLRDLLDTGYRLTHAQAADVGRQAAAALAYAHARGVVHRDVKPANLLFDSEGRLAVADFGLARALSEAAWTEPEGAVLGTARYAAPEQATGSSVDGRSDVYSLALVLYEAVAGVVPFAGDTTIGTLMGRVGAALPGHDALGPLSDTLRRAAAPEPGDRFDAAALAARLAALGHQLGPPGPMPLAGTSPRSGAGDHTEIGHALFPDAQRGRHPEGSDPLALATAVGVAEPDAASGGRRRRRKAEAEAAAGAASVEPAEDAGPSRRRWPWVLAAAVLVAALAGGGAAAWRLKLFTPSHRLPTVTGMTTTAADAALAPHHDRVQVWRHRSSLTARAGTIVRQVPGPGTAVKDGSPVRVVVSTGPPPVAVPSLTGLTGCQAVTGALRASHLHASCTQQASTTVPAGQVMRWDPSTTAPEDSTVTVQLSSGPPMVPVPSLSGDSTCAAVDAALQQANLTPACTSQYEAGTTAGQVYSVSPQSQAPEGSTVTVVVSLGPPPVPVPDVRNLTVPAAINVIDGDGLVVGSIYGPGSGHVFLTNPPAGKPVPPGTVVNLYTQ